MEHTQVPVPIAIQCELLVELMTGVAAQLARLELAETQPDQRAAYASERRKILRKRLRFNINDEAEISALRKHYNEYTSVLAARIQAQPATQSSSA